MAQTRIEGMIIGHELDPSMIADELKNARSHSRSVVPPLAAALGAMSRLPMSASPWAMMVRPTPRSWPLFFRLGCIGTGTPCTREIRHWRCGPRRRNDRGHRPNPRIVSSRTYASSVPLLAALIEGVDLGDLGLPITTRLAELPPGRKAGTSATCHLSVWAASSGLVTDDHLSIVSHNWGMGGHAGGHDKARTCPAPNHRPGGRSPRPAHRRAVPCPVGLRGDHGRNPRQWKIARPRPTAPMLLWSTTDAGA